MPKRAMSVMAHLRGLASGNTALKKRRSGCELLATLCPIISGRESNARPPAPIAMS